MYARASHLAGGLMLTGSGVQPVQAIFLLLLVFVAVFAGLARRLKVPYLILGGDRGRTRLNGISSESLRQLYESSSRIRES